MNGIILSIDVGEKHLGYTTVDLETMEFDSGIYEVLEKRGPNVVLGRVSSLYNFIEEISKKRIYAAVIERQVVGNEIAMEIMYSLVSLIYPHTSRITIFDPKRKFTAINQEYVTKNKQHKKLSIANMRKILATHKYPSFEHLSTILESQAKKDDIADSFNQLLIHMNDLKIECMNIDEIKQCVLEFP